MAEVHLARMSGVGGFEKLLVIKRMLPHLHDDPEFVQMFVNEGRIAARLSHVNVCQVFELCEVDGEVFLAMEYLDGLAWADLAPLVPRQRGIELRCAAAVLGQICEGLRYAHELRDVDGTPMPVVHRDVSPQNLLITTDGVCKLLDFGVSKVLTEGSRTRTGMLKGKLPYMAPEQIRGEPIDARADVFSMGVVLWESLTGERLFQRESDYQIWRAITEEPIPTVTEKAPALPRQIDTVVARALDRDPKRRFPNIRAFSAELRAVSEQVGGPFDSATLGEIVRSLGAPKLAERNELVSSALGRPIRALEKTPLPRVITESSPIVTAEPSVTSSIALRDEAVPIRRKRRRWPIIAATASIGIGIGVAVAIATRDPDEPVRSAAVAVDAAVAVVPADAEQLAAVEPEPVPDPLPIEIDPAPPKKPPRVLRKPPKPPEAVAAEPGFYSVDSKPYAKIFIDDRPHGDTPLFRVQLAAGKHRVRAVRADGKSKQFTITIAPGKSLSSGTLAW